jgi:hypothetical protein
MPATTTTGQVVRMDVNDQAPVLGRSEIEITASPDVAWDVLTAIHRWPQWNPQIKTVSIKGGIHEGSRFQWKAGPGTIKSTIQDLEPLRRIAWTGRTFGIQAIHVYTFEPQGDGTVVRTEESYDGLIARLFRRPLQKTLDSALQSGLRHLKTEAERRARG